LTPYTLVFFPDYSGGNPYQKLLYSPLISSGWNVIPGYLDTAITLKKERSLVIFHLHWLNAIFKNCKNDTEAWIAVDEFINSTNHFQREGGKFIWTIHNHLPHEKKFSEQDLRLRHFICQHADRIHLHCASHIKELSYLPLRMENIHIHRHGNYLNYYGNFNITSRLKEIREEGVKILFLGMLREYKGIDSLISTLKSLKSLGGSITIAGKPENDEIKNKIQNFCNENGINSILRRLSEAEIHDVCSSHNVGILSYNKILTSGTLKLYLSYGMAVITPALPTIIAEDRYHSFIYIDENIKDTNSYWHNKLSKKSHINFSLFNYMLADESRWSGSLFENMNLG
jgi:glycosyltransferase involved in cell wall biosynthesis